MIYFDNAATSFPKPPTVIRDVVKCCRHYCGNPGRSGHFMSLKAAEAIYAVREEVATMLEINAPERVVFTQNATHALNLAIKGMIRERCHVLISNLEHNSVIRPLSSLCRSLGAEYSVFEYQNLDSLDFLKRDDTRFLITTLRSNVIGADVDYESISSFCKKNGIRLILDASQIIGHKRITLRNLYYDALCAPGHKGLMGIQGAGILVLGNETDAECILEGGSGSNTFDDKMPILAPEKYEAGTLSTPAIVGMGSGIRYIKKYGIENIEERICVLTNQLYDILSNTKGISILGCNNGICAFNVGMLSSSQVSDSLSKEKICVRGGYHCAPLTHKYLKTEVQGAVRISFSHYNKESEIDALYKSLKPLLSH